MINKVEKVVYDLGEMEITDGPGSLYNIKGSGLYITFSGYAGYGDAGILVVSA